MNSMVQQLYMIPSFKYLLMSVDDGREEDLQTTDDEKSLYYGKKFDDNLLHQFQYTMGFLELSERPYYTALGLCFAMKDYEGKPTNCSLQQDSHEFVNLSFDRLENLLKPTPQKNLISDIFSAKQCTHMTCSNCGYVKQKIEDYYILSVPVKKFDNLIESFNAYTDGEVISDFRCDNCEQKVDINKRCSFVDMPNILMVHLQKIVFNFDTLMNEKIADRFEFPTYLNMENYSISKIAEKHNINDPNLHLYENEGNQNFEYRLVGVIIHQGVAEAGHYYSLICTDSKLKDTQGANWGNTEDLNWTEFNDTSIKGFDFRRSFEDECFGKSTAQAYNTDSVWSEQWQTTGGGSSKSAYVLIYEKRVHNPIKLSIDKHLVKQHGKTPEDIEEELKEERKNYLRSVYASYDSKLTSSTLNKTESGKDESNENIESTNDVDLETFTSSLECGNIAIPRDLFPYLTIPRSTFVYLSQEQRDKLKYLPVKYDKSSDECYVSVKFNEVQKFIPYNIFKKVWDDNNVFSSERQLNNADFFEFFKNTVKQEDVLKLQDNPEKLSILYELTLKMTFDMLVYAFNNTSIIDVAEVLKKVLLLSDDALVKFSDYILIDNSSEFIRILLKCSEANVRDAVSNILSTAVNRMFTHPDLTAKAETFMKNIFNAVQTQASANWTKFEHFFNLIKQVTIGGDAQLEFMKSNHMETLLADFFLAETSPIKPIQEKRTSMGNNYSKPIYDSLVQTICYLSRHTDPRESEEKVKGVIPPTAMGKKLYEPAENEKKVIVSKQFAVKALKEAFEADAVGKLIAHWSYMNEENSKVFAHVYLKGINETDYEEVAPFLTGMHHFLGIKDDLQLKRMEWLLGTPMLLDGSMIAADPPDKPKLGVYAVQNLNDEAYWFPSTLEKIDSSNESILSLLWRSRKRFENYTMFCIKELLQLGDDIMQYVCHMPSPSYNYARYTDWMCQYVEERRESKSKDAEMYKDLFEHVWGLIQTYSQCSKEYENDLKEKHKKIYNLEPEELEYSDNDQEMEAESEEEEKDSEPENIKKIIEKDDKESSQYLKEYKAFPRPYVIGKVLSEVETEVQSTEDIRVVISELECEYAWNKPLGKKQSSLEFFEYFKRMKGSILNWNKPVNSKKSIFNKNSANEGYVNLGQSMFNKHNEEEEAVETSNLRPICEDDEGDEETKNMQEYLGLNDTVTKDKDKEINKELNDREEDKKVMNHDIVTDQKDDLEKQQEENKNDVHMDDNDDQEQVEKRQEAPKNNIYKTNSVVLRVSVYNFYKKPINIEIDIQSKDGNPNFYVPKSSIKAEIRSNKAKTLAYFHKIHPNKAFGDYSFTYKTDIVSDEQKHVSFGNNAEQGTDILVETDPQPATTGAYDMVMQDEINCDQCTLFNPISNHKCDVCGAVLPHRK